MHTAKTLTRPQVLTCSPNLQYRCQRIPGARDAPTVDGWLGAAVCGDGLGSRAWGPVLLQVRGTLVVPTGAVYEPTEGAVTVP